MVLRVGDSSLESAESMALAASMLLRVVDDSGLFTAADNGKCAPYDMFSWFAEGRTTLRGGSIGEMNGFW